MRGYWSTARLGYAITPSSVMMTEIAQANTGRSMKKWEIFTLSFALAAPPEPATAILRQGAAGVRFHLETRLSGRRSWERSAH